MGDSSQKISPGRLMDEILAMPEYEIRQQLLAFNTSIYIFDKNFKELHRLIDFLLNHPEAEMLLAERNKDRLREVQIDIIRRLHNFVAASLSLIDHTRRLYNKLYADSDQFPEYQTKVDSEFKVDPLSQFVKCLRQYCQHYKAPDIGIKVTVTQSEEGMAERKQSILMLDDLKTFDSWNSHAKKYMGSQGEDIDILEVASAYQEKVIAFYKWFQSRQIEIHSDELERFESKQAEFALLIFEGRVNACLNSKNNMPYRGEEIFLGIFSSGDFETIEQIPIDSSERVKLSIKILEGYYPVSDELKEKILQLYGAPGFFAPRNWDNIDNGKENAP
jgi:hypothetical protein